MEIIDEDEIYFNDIFHYLNGNYFKDKNSKKYKFKLLKEDNSTIYYKVDKIIKIADPGYDSSFKYLFSQNPLRLQNFLNKVYFEQNGMKIKNLDYCVGEYNVIGKMFNSGSLRSDITCKGSIDDKKQILINIEIQIKWLSNLDDRLFEYGTLLRNSDTNIMMEKEKGFINEEEEEEEEEEAQKKGKNKKEGKKKKKVERKYNDAIVIAFVLDRKSGSNTNKLELLRTDNENKNKTISNKFKIIEVNVFKEFSKIQNNEKVILFDKELDKDGRDWIKFLGLRFWATRTKKKFWKFVFPPLKKSHKYSSNDYLNQAIIESLDGSNLSKLLDSDFEKTISEGYYIGRDEGYDEGYENGLEKGIKKTQLYSLLKFIIKGQLSSLDLLPLEYKYTKNEIIDIMSQFNDINTNTINLEYLIDYLEKRSCFDESE